MAACSSSVPGTWRHNSEKLPSDPSWHTLRYCILIGPFFLKTIRTIGDKNIPSRRELNLIHVKRVNNWKMHICDYDEKETPPKFRHGLPWGHPRNTAKSRFSRNTEQSLGKGEQVIVTWQPPQTGCWTQSHWNTINCYIFGLLLRYFHRIKSKMSGKTEPKVFLCKDKDGNGAVPAAFEKVRYTILWTNNVDQI